jgi:hypothetical protein
VVRLEADGRWTDLGRLGDALEINSVNVHNGQLYGGTIPRAEVFRFDASVAGRELIPPTSSDAERRPPRSTRTPEHGDASWISIRRFLEPAGYEFKNLNEWARVTSLTTFQGKQFASMGSCTSSYLDAPCDFRGQVYAMQAGRCVSYDRDLGAGWKHLTALRRGDRLELYIDGQLAATSTTFAPTDYDLNNDSPLRIGFGEVDYFSGKIRDVRLYRRALCTNEISNLAMEFGNDPRIKK